LGGAGGGLRSLLVLFGLDLRNHGDHLSQAAALPLDLGRQAGRESPPVGRSQLGKPLPPIAPRGSKVALLSSSATNSVAGVSPMGSRATGERSMGRLQGSDSRPQNPTRVPLSVAS
jgi:hypothetical protein